MSDLTAFGLHIFPHQQLALLTSKNRAADGFRKLAFDLVKSRILRRTKDLILLDTPATDGAIDFSGKDLEGNRIIGECKLQKNLIEAKKSVKYLAANLMEILTLSETATSAPCYQQFTPWRDRTLREYIYCLSYSFGSNAEKEEFKTLLERTFCDLSESTGNTYLAAITIILYDWNDLQLFLQNSKTLYKKWVAEDTLAEAPTPPVNLKKSPSRVYKDYLQENTMPYFSRDEYHKSHANTQALVTETDILDYLLQDSEDAGCVLHGKSGIGKTRLMLELGHMAQQRGWHVIKISSQLKELKNLEKILVPTFKYLLLLENIPESMLLSNERIQRLHQKVKHSVIKLIGIYHLPPNAIVTPESAPEFWWLHLGFSASAGEKNYMRYVSEKILETAKDVNHVICNLDECSPVFAVFLHYSYIKLKEKYPAIQLPTLSHFQEWLTKLLPLTFSSYSSLSSLSTFTNQDWANLQQEHKEIFYLFTLMPTSAKVTKMLSESYLPIIGNLKSHGWLEENQDLLTDKKLSTTKGLRMSCDAVVDELLKLYLDTCKNSLRQEVIEIIHFAIQYDSFDSCYMAFYRIADWDGFQNTPSFFYPILSHSLRKYGTQLGNPEKFITTSLLGDRELVHLIVENPDYFTNTMVKPEFAFKLSYLMNRFSQNQKKDKLENSAKNDILFIFNHWIAANPDFMEDKTINLLILSSYMLLFGAASELGDTGKSIRKCVSDYFILHPINKESQSLMLSWLNSGGSTGFILPFLEKWLNKYGHHIGASGLIRAWLKAWGEKEIVQRAMETWLNIFPNTREAGFIIKSWLDANGYQLIIREAMNTWLNLYIHDTDASLVIQAWLNSVGEKEIVRSALKVWLETFSHTLHASSLMQAWLKVGGEKETVQQALTINLNIFPDQLSTNTLIQAWLKVGGEKHVVKHATGIWLNTFANTMEACFLIATWMETTSEIEFVKNAIITWLKAFPGTLESKFIILPWLLAGGDKDIVQQAMEIWLTHFSNAKEAGFIIKTWLDVGGEKESIKNAITIWQNAFPKTLETSDVIHSWLKAGGEKEIVKETLFTWLNTFPTTMEAYQVIQVWLESNGEKEIVQSAMEMWLNTFNNTMEASFVIKTWLHSGGAKEVIKNYMVTWLNLFPNASNANQIIQAWLNTGGEKEVVGITTPSPIHSYSTL